jgi:hypothetical protein
VLVNGEDNATLGRRIREELGDAIRLVRFPQMSQDKFKTLSRIRDILDTDVSISWLYARWSSVSRPGPRPVSADS